MVMLKIYNSMGREKQVFVPMQPGRVRLYVCGITAYDYCHVGHGRVLVVFDMITRWLAASGYEVEYVRNITDIDDKIIRRAAENGEPIGALTERYTAAMREDAAALGVLPPAHEPRATEFIPQMVAMIDVLIERGLAYPAANGDVYYAVREFSGYGKLSGKSLEELRAGERVEIDAHKRDPLDFVLWKAAKTGEPSWPSPWGDGRPGWHIECSAMSEHYFSHHFDIHGGGQDLQFPHHENEIAQSEGAHQCTLANYWIHNGFVRVDNEKMSKSLGNFFTIREVLGKYDAETLRFFILRAHYRSPLNYSDHQLDDARQALNRLYTALRNVPPENGAPDWEGPYAVRFKTAMDDDFNTSEAIAVLFELANEANKHKSPRISGLLKSMGGILGLLQNDPARHLQALAEQRYSAEQIEQLIADRAAARKAKDFAEGDRIRQQLLEAGIVLEDGGQGTIWRRN
ncbi:MAG TPA: cysteine--tRNA ligase [Burkholderiales bacterium]|nr:cysteine--tRNA ligase [Burkholderiales bacterium]